VAPEVEGEGDRPRERARIAFTREERAWLMRQVKLLRYVHRRFIPYLADIAVEARVSAGEIVCEQGQPTTPGLIIVACGKLELWRKPLRGGDPVLLRELTAGDSLGNTGLIADVHWEYTAVGKEDAWTLTIHRDDLANLLRGRAELSLSVLKGFYKTFVRRLRQVKTERRGRGGGGGGGRGRDLTESARAAAATAPPPSPQLPNDIYAAASVTTPRAPLPPPPPARPPTHPPARKNFLARLAGARARRWDY